jgi:hypothetical protein
LGPWIILRCRELGVPRYTAFRRLLHLRVPSTFDELSSNKEWVEELRAVYDNTMRSVLVRHCPELEPYVGKLDNAFALWSRAGSKP